MSIARIASRYAKSLLDLSIEQNKLDQVVTDIKMFDEAVENRDLYLLIKSPIVRADKKEKVFNALFGDRVDTLTSSFFNIIIKKGREGYLPEIANAFLEQYRIHKKITKATVTSSITLNESQLAKIKTELVKLGAATGEVELDSIVDPSIIGGLVLEINDQLYDASVKSKLAQYKKEILDNTYIKSL